RKARVRSQKTKKNFKQRSDCRNCGAIIVQDQQICHYCGTLQFFEFKHAVAYVTQSRTFRKFAIYPGMMIISLVYVFYVYSNAMNTSETKLVQLAPIWIFGFLFGCFGYTAEKFLPLFLHGQANSVWEAFFRWCWDGVPLSLFYLPVPIFPF